MTEQEIASICKKYNIRSWKLNPQTNLIDVEKSVVLSGIKLSELPLPFGDVIGDFYCSSNNLTSLEHSPNYVSGGFYCYGNKLTSLEYAPKNIGGSFDCTDNNLTSLEHSPENVGGNFVCYNNNLTSLEYAPKNVGGYFYCFSNNLTSLKSLFFDINGQSRNIYIGGDLRCSNNPIPIYEYRWWFLGTMKDNVVGGKIKTGNENLSNFLNEHKAPDARDLPKLFAELRKFEK